MSQSRVPQYLDERREWLRVDDTLLLDYRVVAREAAFGPPDADQPLADAITTFITKPTADLLERHAPEGDPLLIPWLKKIDWVLEVILQQLARDGKPEMPLPRLTRVNISGGGISFHVSRPLNEGDELDLRLILPPFVPITARAVVTRVEAVQAADRLYSVATRFVAMEQDDHERVIRHIFQVQAERLRARHLSGPVIRD